MTSAHDRFLARWSRRKREASRLRDEAAAAAPAPRLGADPAGPATHGPGALRPPPVAADARAAVADREGSSSSPHAQAAPHSSDSTPSKASTTSAPPTDRSQPGIGVQRDAREHAPLPAVDALTPESDFRPFMQAEVDDATRNAALARLFADPHFSTSDGLDVYIDDYGKTEPIPATLLAGLKQLHEVCAGGATGTGEPHAGVVGDGTAGRAGAGVTQQRRGDAASPAAVDAPAHEAQGEASIHEPHDCTSRDDAGAARPPHDRRNRSTSEPDAIE